MVIADQSMDGVFDERCMKLAALCSKAMDYTKNGEPVDIYNYLPSPLFKFYSPDWRRGEVTGSHEPDYYESDRALGYLFRNIDLHDPNEPIEGFRIALPGEVAPLTDAISCALMPLVQSTLNAATEPRGVVDGRAKELHAHYVREMQYICMTHTLVDDPDVRLTEEEVVLGTIVAICTQPRWRTDRSCRMRLHAEGLVQDVRAQIVPSDGPQTEGWLRAGLWNAWAVWSWAQYHRDKEFIESFSLVALGVVLDCLERLGGLPEA